MVDHVVASIVILIIVIALFIAGIIFFAHYKQQLINDFIIDGIGSLLDNFIAGLGALGLDIGDWIAAAIIFSRDKKIVGKPIAYLVAWEATNFLPLSFIPVFGEILEWILCVFPASTIGKIFFDKSKAAKKEAVKFEEEMEVAKEAGILTSEEAGMDDKIQGLIKSGEYADALKEAKTDEEEITANLIRHIDGMIEEVNSLGRQIASQEIDAPDEIVNILQEGMNAAGQLLSQAKEAEANQEYKKAIESATKAKEIIVMADHLAVPKSALYRIGENSS